MPVILAKPNTVRLRLPRHPRESGDLVDVHEKHYKTCAYEISISSNEVPAFAGMTVYWRKRTVLRLR